MGELICLEEWKKKKHEEEMQQIQEDIKSLREELSYVMADWDEMPQMYQQQLTHMMPVITDILGPLDGYTYSDFTLSKEGDE